ncbi:uncharacterized protein LOC116248587 [Nymphaea colorata]|uniref:Uncharacterized protein n=1 Tax=Nymphaea colorata TaxID=210225 RepID=A0A5K1A3M7_9MAGN|nr:uncharacterized protein LOC116248587 [Nymphaea colorata]
MESNRKRKGFMRSKLVMTLYRATKPTTSTLISGKVKPDPFPSHASVDYIVEGKSIPHTATKQRMMDMKKKGDEAAEVGAHASDGVSGGGEDSVDKRAALYISRVQERIRLQRAESERRQR